LARSSPTLDAIETVYDDTTSQPIREQIIVKEAEDKCPQQPNIQHRERSNNKKREEKRNNKRKERAGGDVFLVD